MIVLTPARGAWRHAWSGIHNHRLHTRTASIAGKGGGGSGGAPLHSIPVVVAAPVVVLFLFKEHEVDEKHRGQYAGLCCWSRARWECRALRRQRPA